MPPRKPSPSSYTHRVAILATPESNPNSSPEHRDVDIRKSTQCTLLQLMGEIVALLDISKGQVTELTWPPADTGALAFVLQSVVPTYESGR